jgi:hypothetical protein
MRIAYERTLLMGLTNINAPSCDKSSLQKGDAAMLLNLEDEIKAAYKKAASAAECAKTCRLPEERDGWLTLESGYLLLARALESPSALADR